MLLCCYKPCNYYWPHPAQKFRHLSDSSYTIHSLNHLQIHRVPCDFLNVPSMVQPQELCSYYSHYLESSLPVATWFILLLHSDLYFYDTLSEKPFLTIWSKTSPPPYYSLYNCIIFYCSTYHNLTYVYMLSIMTYLTRNVSSMKLGACKNYYKIHRELCYFICRARTVFGT